MGKDRRDIAPFLGQYFPSLDAKATSDDWHALLNAVTGLDVDLDEENATAFDKWRQALSGKGYPVWSVDDAQKAAIKARGDALLAAEMKRRADEAAKLAALAQAAPNVTAQDLLKQAAPTP